MTFQTCAPLSKRKSSLSEVAVIDNQAEKKPSIFQNINFRRHIFSWERCRARGDQATPPTDGDP